MVPASIHMSALV